MNLSNFALALILITTLFTGCARDEGQLWHAFLQTQSSRSPAQTEAAVRPRCFLDRYNDQAITDEVGTFTGQYSNGRRLDFQRASLTWSGLPKSTIDVLNQKLYLSSSDRPSWFTVDVRQKDCTDLTCFSNKLYANPTNEGLLHNWYYLKTGYAMAATDAYPWFENGETPTYHVTDVPVESYLFNKDEWKALWLQANLLPKLMLHMPDLQTIHRLPHGYIPTEWQSTGTCGWSLGTNNAGIILLSDECLTLNRNPLDSTAFFYASTTHELGHRLASWNLGRRGTAFDGMDEDPAFLAISDWSTEELVAAGGTSTRQWKHTDDTTGWLSDYAKSSPHEDWAESVGYYRTNANRSIAKAPKKYDYLKKNVFDGKGYALADLKVDYTAQVTNALTGGVSEWAAPCLSDTPLQSTLTADQQAVEDTLTFDLPIEPTALKCLKDQFTLKLSQALSDLRYNEPEGCATLDASGVQSEVIKNALPGSMSGVMAFLQTDRRIADLIGGVQNFRTSVSTEYDGKSVFLSCYGQDDSEGCFKTKVAAEFERLYEKYKVQLSAGSDALVDLERQRFIRMNPYADTQVQVSTFFSGIFTAFTAELDTSSQKVWQNCAEATPDFTLTNVPVEPYSAGANFVAPSMLKCLNEGAVSVMADIRGKAATEQGIEVFTTEAKSWISKEVLFPRVKAIFDTALQTAKVAEKAKIDAAKDAAIVAVVTGLTSDLSWETAVGVYALPDCRVASAKKLADQLQATQYQFTALDPILTQFSDTVCEKVRVAVRADYRRSGSSTTMDTGEVSVAQMASLDPIWTAFKTEMQNELQTRYARCRSSRYSGNASKRFCLFSEIVNDDVDHHNRQSWYWAAHRALITWFAQPATDQLFASKGYPDELARRIALKRLEKERQDLAALIAADFLR